MVPGAAEQSHLIWVVPALGRGCLHAILYMATVTATRHNSAIRDFYTGLCRRGKPKKVALVAAMRKLLLILNAVVRDQVS